MAKVAGKASKAQSSIADKVIKDQALARMCQEYHESRDTRTTAQKRQHRLAQNGINAMVAVMKGVKSGDVVRVGDFLINITDRAGGGFKVKKWTSRKASVKAAK